MVKDDAIGAEWEGTVGIRQDLQHAPTEEDSIPFLMQGRKPL